jgi:hypothetical protein
MTKVTLEEENDIFVVVFRGLNQFNQKQNKKSITHINTLKIDTQTWSTFT